MCLEWAPSRRARACRSRAPAQSRHAGRGHAACWLWCFWVDHVAQEVEKSAPESRGCYPVGPREGCVWLYGVLLVTDLLEHASSAAATYCGETATVGTSIHAKLYILRSLLQAAVIVSKRWSHPTWRRARPTTSDMSLLAHTSENAEKSYNAAAANTHTSASPPSCLDARFRRPHIGGALGSRLRSAHRFFMQPDPGSRGFRSAQRPALFSQHPEARRGRALVRRARMITQTLHTSDCCLRPDSPTPTCTDPKQGGCNPAPRPGGSGQRLPAASPLTAASKLFRNYANASGGTTSARSM